MTDATFDSDGGPFIGRERECAELRELVLRSRVVLVYGPAGVGKTSLVRAALRGVHDLPEVVHVSLDGVVEPREAIERSVRALGVQPPPFRPEAEEEALRELLEAEPRTLVWDDVDARSRKLGPMVARFNATEGAARVVFISRRYISAKEATLRAPVLGLSPLPHEDAVALVRALEAARGRTLADEVAAAAAGNPMLIRLSLASEGPTTVLGNTSLALRRAVEERCQGVSGTILSLLLAAGTPLDEAEVVRAVGSGAKAVLDELRKYLIVVRDGSKVAITPPAAALVRDVIGEIAPEGWRLLSDVAGRTLAASPHDDTAIVAAARAQIELEDAPAALAVLKAHPLARATAEPGSLERVLRAIAARSANDRVEALRMLAREQLRAGDYESARRTLDDLPKPKTRDEIERIALLRAECHVRAGEPEAAQRAIDGLPKKAGKPSPSVALSLTQAQLAILRGELAEARALLEELAPEASQSPTLEARRAVEIAASYLYEESYDHTHEWVARARAAQRAAALPIEPVVTILDVHALLGLGMVDRAEEVIAREARGRPHALMLEVAALVRRGELARAVEVGDAALGALDRRADLLFRSVVARDLARACIGVGDLSRAARMLRVAEAGADEPALAALRPICDAEQARLSSAKGDLGRAQRRIDRAHAAIPSSPFVTIDREVIHGRMPPSFDDAPAVVRAYAQLRASEGAVASGDLGAAAALAEPAHRFYAESALHHEAVRAELVLAEALGRIAMGYGLGDASSAEIRARARIALDSCEALATARGYVPLMIGASLVRAATAEARGDLADCVAAIATALRVSGDDVDVALSRAARRVGVSAREPSVRLDMAPRASWPPGDERPPDSSVAISPFASLVERLGLLRPAEVLWRVGPRTWLRGKAEPPPERVACAVEVDERRVRADDGRALEMPEQRIALLCALADAGEMGATLEELFARVWRGSFHPLRHRNAVYVALARLKDSLKPFGRDVTLAHDGDRYRLAGNAPVGVRRRADERELASFASADATPR